MAAKNKIKDITAQKTTTRKRKKGFNKKYLVIVESPAKAKTIEKFLGKDYGVLSSMGHVRDLAKSILSVDIEKNFEPHYILIRGKAKIVNALKAAAQRSEKVYLAPDPDREGEAIAWHLSYLLAVEKEKFKRIEFNEITKEAVRAAIENQREIDMPRVNAQQARRVLDRLVGYKISPLLWAKIRRGLSAGRVQSVAMRIICDREAEIRAFNKEEYWSIQAFFKTENGESVVASVQSKLPDTKKIEIRNEAEAREIEAELKQASFTVQEVRRKERAKNSAAPFITSTLQQEASRKLGYNARKTMMIAQQLYEGIALEGETVGLITYMRTDSVRIADEALARVRELISSKFGGELLPETPKFYKTKKSAQDAHEAIRPTDVFREPNAIKDLLTPEQFKLYSLIWKRFVACQMKSAVLDVTSVDIIAGNYLLRATGSIVRFPGFMSVYLESSDEGAEEQNEEMQLNNGRPDDVLLPELREGQALLAQEIKPEQHFTQPPPRFTEASLVKVLEEQGIGRPSTYAPIISTIQSRMYVDRQGKMLIPTELGMNVNDQLMKYFPDILDVGFTASIEEVLDKIMEGNIQWQDVIKDFYVPFSKAVAIAEKEMEDIKVPDELTNEKCELCGKPLAIKMGRFGKFLACTGFPECRNTKAIKKIVPGAKCPLCGSELVEKTTRTRKIFYGCANYPACNFASWDKPIENETCPTCGAFLVEKKKKGEGLQKLCILCDIKKAGASEADEEKD